MPKHHSGQAIRFHHRQRGGRKMTYQGFIPPYDVEPDDEPEEEHDDTLGSCGCVDYHVADCHLVTGGSGERTRKGDWDGHDWDADEGGY
jgi:hypothetical protein